MADEDGISGWLTIHHSPFSKKCENNLLSENIGAISTIYYLLFARTQQHVGYFGWDAFIRMIFTIAFLVRVRSGNLLRIFVQV